MKKFLTIFLIYGFIILPSSAIVSDEDIMSEKYIMNHGHSKEMVRLIDLQNAQINGEKSRYKSDEPEWYKEKKVNFIRQVFIYLDPASDDGKFMQHNIDYANRWDDL
jgi:hypothetical protein